MTLYIVCFIVGLVVGGVAVALIFKKNPMQAAAVTGAFASDINKLGAEGQQILGQKKQ